MTMNTTNPQAKTFGDRMYTIGSKLLNMMGLSFKSEVDCLTYKLKITEIDLKISESQVEQRNLEIEGTQKSLKRQIETLMSERAELKTKVRDLELQSWGITPEDLDSIVKYMIDKEPNPGLYKSPIIRLEGNELRISLIRKDEQMNWGDGNTILTIDLVTYNYVKETKSCSDWKVEWNQIDSGHILDISTLLQPAMSC